MGEAIVVAPDGFTRWGGAQYLDSPAIGDYETHVVREVIPAIDARFRTVAARDARAIGGKSSGGFGALVLAMRHPELFAAVASHAGDMYFELSALPDLPVAARTLRRHGGVAGFLRHFEATREKGRGRLHHHHGAGQAAAYSPDPARAARRRAAVRPRRRARSTGPSGSAGRPGIPSSWSATHAEALRRMKLIFIDAGTRDEHNLDLGARIFVPAAARARHRLSSTRSSTTATAAPPTVTTSRCRSWRPPSARRAG